MQPWKPGMLMLARKVCPTLQWSHGLAAVETTRRTTTTGLTWCRFNGATALQPWKLELWIGDGAATYALQWSHGLAAVETRKAGGTPKDVARLQWSHGLAAVETRGHP